VNDHHPFIAVEGPDGAGKTTVTSAVASQLGQRGLAHVARRQIATGSPFAANLMEHIAQMLWHSGDETDLPDGFWAHLQAAWFTAHGEQVLGPALAAGPVILDGWYYKLQSALLGQGWSRQETVRLFDRVRRPDHVVLLRVTPQLLWERRQGRLRPTEMGMHATKPDTDLGRDSFLAYQQASLDRLTEMAAELGWSVVDVPADEEAGDTVRRVGDIVEAFLDRHGQPFPGRSDYTWPHVDAPLRSAVDRQLHRSLSDRDGSGVIGEFEEAFAAFAGAEYALAFSSGTSALHAMCVAAGLQAGDEIIAPAYTFYATATPFAYEGVKVVFADADALGNVDADALPGLVTDRTKAVIVTHMWGIPCDMTAIGQFCQQYGLLLLEDCSHAHFAAWDGRRVGTFGAMAVFSTNQKAITTGEGGVLVTADGRFRDLALLHGHYNKRCFGEIDSSRPYYPYALTGMGLKSRATTLGAAIGLDQLSKAGDIEMRRREILAFYIDTLRGNPVISPVLADPPRGRHGLYVAGFRFNPQAATVSIDQFESLLTQAGADFDVPGSTGIIAAEPLFHRRTRTQAWDVPPHVPAATPAFPGAASFIATFLKGPLWGYPGDDDAVAHQLKTLDTISAQVAK
jgi:dTDP-4-amino-4,6-dideoxygalactose transaminase/thymidylate kinase